MPRQGFKARLVKHQISLPYELDLECVNYCENHAIDLRVLATIALDRFMNELGTCKDSERIERNGLQ